MQEWLNAILTDQWLLGFSMGIATKAILKGMHNVRTSLADQQSDETPVDAARRGRN